MEAENTAYKEVVTKENPMKEWLIDYVGEKEEPENNEVTVEMIVSVMVKEFPRVCICLSRRKLSSRI
jgi:hypothetical protein